MSSYQKKKASERKLHDDITATPQNNSLETVRSRMGLLKRKKITVDSSNFSSKNRLRAVSLFLKSDLMRGVAARTREVMRQVMRWQINFDSCRTYIPAMLPWPKLRANEPRPKFSDLKVFNTGRKNGFTSIANLDQIICKCHICLILLNFATWHRTNFAIILH